MDSCDPWKRLLYHYILEWMLSNELLKQNWKIVVNVAFKSDNQIPWDNFLLQYYQNLYSAALLPVVLIMWWITIPH